jgi:hypothetical protein
MEERYFTRNLTMEEIARELGCSRPNVVIAFKRIGITSRGPGPRLGTVFNYDDRACDECGESFTPTGPSHHFCPSCAIARRTGECPVCKKTFVRDYLEQVYCSKSCAYDRNGEFGKRSVNAEGYVTIKVPDGYPGRRDNGRVPEHRYVMQEQLGRPLALGETIHHVNGDKTDNRIENLQLRAGRHGTGVVLRCRCCGSLDIESLPLADEEEPPDTLC